MKWTLKILPLIFVLTLSCDHGVSPILETRQLVFYSYDANPRAGLFLVNVDGSGYSRLTPDSILVTTQFDCSPSGESIVFVGNYDICTISKQDRIVRFITTGSAWDDAPSWTSDGNSILFRSNRTGRYAIWICNPDGSDLRQLTPDTANTWWPRQIPKTTLVAFTYIGSPNTLAVVDIDGTGLQVLTPDSLSVTDHFSPSFDGTYIAFDAIHGTRRQTNVFTVGLADRKIVQRTFTDVSGYPYASPYSHEILFSTATHLILLNLVNGTSAAVSPLSIPPSSVAWMPNRRTIAFEGGVDPFSIYMLNLDSSQPWKLTKANRTEKAPKWNTAQW